MDGALKPSWRAVSKQCSFGVRIHWFREDGRSIRVVSFKSSRNAPPYKRRLCEGALRDYSKDGCVVD